MKVTVFGLSYPSDNRISSLIEASAGPASLDAYRRGLPRFVVIRKNFRTSIPTRELASSRPSGISEPLARGESGTLVYTSDSGFDSLLIKIGNGSICQVAIYPH
jgi:hypothetical protein